MSKARIIADYAGTGATSDLATQAELDASETALGFQSVPHIIPDTLYPAVAGKLLDGSTSHGATYGVAQSDGRMYYYTDIKGSKPIKDPRIGAHFGSQRYKFKSLQLLEQETATHGSDVYSIYGREWLRGVGGWSHWSDAQTSGGVISGTQNDFFEITGYFSSANYIAYTDTHDRSVRVTIDGGTESGTSIGGAGSSGSPLGSRYVDSGSMLELTSTTLGIHTIKIRKQGTASTTAVNGIELIAQDTSSTANKSKIQIPAQNVVSYGKKFAIPATAHHYNPFAFAGDGTTAVAIGDTTSHGKVADGWTGSTATYFDSTLDTSTSLGLSAWESGSNYYRPVNGGRIVKWVDSTGAIKTSVNMMPPEAHSIEGGVISSGVATGSVSPTGHSWSTQYQPQFGNKTVGSNLWTAMADNSSYQFSTRPSGGLNGEWENTSGYGLAYVAVTLTQGKLYRIRFDASSVSGVASYIGTASNSSASNWKNKSLITNGTNLTSVFTADSETLMIVMHTASGTAGFELANMTLFELEEPSLQAEVAKNFHYREFGNGSANSAGGGGTSNTYADASTLNTADNIAYVMDDGLTSLSGTAANGGGEYLALSGNQFGYFTFIGTGFSWQGTGWSSSNLGSETIAQNLPYGTHIVKIHRDGSNNMTVLVDGVTVYNVGSGWFHQTDEISIHQPKMPPIPEDAVVIADYMLMADHVGFSASNSTAKTDIVEKGVRQISSSRDIFYDSGASINVLHDANGFKFHNANTTGSIKLPFFGSSVNLMGGDPTTRFASASNYSNITYSSGTKGTVVDVSSGNDLAGSIRIPLTETHPVNTTLTASIAGASNGYGDKLDIYKFYVASPIHTSHHYQTFETPYLHELVGGDRNMEQNNLIVTPDGKSWSEVTRDTSYIGNIVLSSTTDHASGWSTAIVLDEWRGGSSGATNRKNFNKDWAIAYDRMICLKDGTYEVNVLTSMQSGNGYFGLMVNGTATGDAERLTMQRAGANQTQEGYACVVSHDFKRGDTLRPVGEWGGETGAFNFLQIKKL